MKANGFENLVGNTPTVRFLSKELSSSTRLWIKMESYNPTGSIKDRTCIFLIKDALQSNRLKPGMTLLDASSGNMACAIAYFGSIMGYKVKVICGSRLTEDKANFITFFGGELVRFGQITMDGNRLCRDQIIPEAPEKYCFLDQLHNWANPRAAYETLAPELLADFPQPTAIVGSLGSGGTMLGIASHMRDTHIKTHIISVEAASGTKLPGVAAFSDGDYVTPFIQKGFDEQLFPIRHVASKEDAVKRVLELKEQGFFVGLQTGAVVHAAIEEAKKRELSGDIIAISGDSGWKNMDTLAKIVL